jgi:hypothetical protein
MGPTALLHFPSEGRRATDFITLKIHRPRPVLNPRTLGPVASTLTTRPPRATGTCNQAHEIIQFVTSHFEPIYFLYFEGFEKNMIFISSVALRTSNTDTIDFKTLP